MSTDYSKAKTTPMMKQWVAIKEKLRDDTPEGAREPIVFCRVGDFYELFYDDAERATKILDIQLTKRKIADTHYPMAGVPVRSLETYVARLVSAGYRVAIIEQMEDAKQTKGTIKRELTRIVSKGTVTEDAMLTPGKNNYIAAVTESIKGKTRKLAIAVCDLSTGDFRTGEFEERNKLIRAFIKYSPVEILYSQDREVSSSLLGIPLDRDEILTPVNPYWFNNIQSLDLLKQHFNVTTLQGFGIADNSLAVGVAGVIIRYLKETQFGRFPHITKLKSFDIENTMTLDATAIKSLELFTNTQDNSSFASLYELMSETVTPMGSRLMRHWIANPLGRRGDIEERLDAVELLMKEDMIQHTLRSTLSTVGDIERLITRISIGSAKPDEIIRLVNSLETLPSLLKIIGEIKDGFPKGLIDSIDTCDDLVYLIRKSIREQPQGSVGEGKIIQEGYNEELDRLITIISEGLAWVDRYVEREKQRTSIQSMKIKQNNVFGFYIEVSRKDLDKIPENYVKKQVMVNAARFFTEELKNWERDVLESEVKILDLETRLYRNLLAQMSEYTPSLQTTSNAIAILDCLSSNAYLAERRSYNRPNINDGNSFVIRGGRHPVIESIATDQLYIPNDVNIDYNSSRLMIITGPNFSGKSSLLRMTALIAIMTQIGSFVPAEGVELGVLDRIFTRIGASDNLVAGQSTFMLEMVDAANLVNNSTGRSLIIADELGRGTSTYDGLAIAWSIAEFLHNAEESPKTLVASHYHQLAELEDLLKNCKNYHFSIRFKKGKPIFDHKLMRGSSDRSFGVEVAKLAGLPSELIDRARQILSILESKAADVNPEGVSSKKLVDLVIEADGKTSLTNWFGDEEEPAASDEKSIQLEHEVVKELEKLNIDNISPIEALQILLRLKELI